MGKLQNIITPLHTSTKREYLPRMQDEKVHCMKVAKRYDREYWDGDRRYGFGGYRYDGRWKPVAEKLIETYNLKQNCKILDVGCGMAHLLYEIKQLLPQAEVSGFDISTYALENTLEEIRPFLFQHQAENPYPFTDNQYDLVISLNSLHNLPINNLKTALREIERVGISKYLTVESYRNEQELFNLQCWALTCEAFFSVEEWKWLFKEFGYKGDYEFIFFE